MKHTHAEMIAEWIKDTSRVVQWRSKRSENPTDWMAASNPSWIGDCVYRFADDWRNKFRDALERGEVVQYFKGREWREPPLGLKWLYGDSPEKYQIKPAKPILTLDGVEDCLILLYAGGGNRGTLRRALEALQKHRR